MSVLSKTLRWPIVIVITLAIALTACPEGRLVDETSQPDASQPDAHTEPLPTDPATVIEGAERPPGFIMATSDRYWEARPAPSVEEAAGLLRDDPELAPLAEALAEAGWNEDEAATLFALGAGYGSGQPHDPVRARSLQFHDALNDAIGTMHEELDALEADQDVTIDRAALPRIYDGPLPIVP